MKKIFNCVISLQIILLLTAISITPVCAAKNQGYIWPVAGATVSRGFSSGHDGLDLKVKSGDQFVAIADGTVMYVFTGCNNADGRKTGTCKTRGICSPNYGFSTASASRDYCNYGFGNGIVIYHNNGMWSQYAHMSSVNGNLKKGDHVTQGTYLGTVGSSGNSSGVHAHFGMNQGTNTSNYWKNPSVNPLNYVEPDDTGGGSSNPPATTNVSVTTTSAQNVTETNAVVYGTVSYSGTRPSEVGVYFGASPDNMTIVGRDAINHNKNPFDMWYDLNKNGVTLSRGTTYYWQCYAIANGTEYKGEVKSFTTPGDITPPTISDISVTDIDESGYTVNCTISDDTNIGPIQFPTWTEYNGQDDLIWHTYTDNAATNSINVSYRINCSEHNNETGIYITHIYAWDWSSNQTVYNGEITVVNIEPKQQEYTVTYNANGGTGEPGNQIKIQGENLILDNTTPTRSGYTFVGWGLTPDSTNAEYQPGDTYSIDADITLYAIWKEDTAELGDVDGNGRVDSIDGLRFLKYIADLDVTIDEKVADINSDGTINSLDALRLLKIIAEQVSDI